MLAASALSVALTAFGHPAWPAELQQFGSYEAEELAACKAALVRAQASQPAEMIRRGWRAQHESHGYDDYKDQWAKALLLFSCRSNLDGPPPPEEPVPMEA